MREVRAWGPRSYHTDHATLTIPVSCLPHSALIWSGKSWFVGQFQPDALKNWARQRCLGDALEQAARYWLLRDAAVASPLSRSEYGGWATEISSWTTPQGN